MSKVLFDNNVPQGLVPFLRPEHEVATAFEMGWAELQNGRLLDAAAAEGFDILVSCDQNVPAQQNLAGRSIALLILGSNRWPLLQTKAGKIQERLRRLPPGGRDFIEVPEMRKPRAKPPRRY